MTAWDPGRPLTAYEERMKRTRTDLWEAAFGGVYRFALSHDGIVELERISGPAGKDGTPQGKGIGAIAAGMTRADAVTATRDECVNLIRLALLGGALAVIDGETVVVTPAMVAAIMVKHVEAVPIASLWPLATRIMDALINGRRATDEEIENFAIPSRGPVVPPWALGAIDGQEQRA